MLDMQTTRNLSKSHFLLLIVAVSVALPPYVTKGFNFLDIPNINSFILTHSIKSVFEPLFPLFNLIALVVLFGSFLVGEKFTRVFSFFIFIAYLVRAFPQNISISDQYAGC